jgi:isoleucyl-tRNA synthetase
VDATGEVAAAVVAHREFIAAETLATSVELGPVEGGFAGEVGDGETVTVAVARTV